MQERWKIGAVDVASKAAGPVVYEVLEKEADFPRSLRSLRVLQSIEIVGDIAVGQVVAGRVRWWTLGWSQL
jgi:hypothetical protein